jgi:hypothetical protein
MKFGIMCRGMDFQIWQAEAIRKLIIDGHRPVVLITGNDEIPATTLWQRVANKKRETLLFTLTENRFFLPQSRKTTSLEKELKDIPLVRCTVAMKKSRSVFSDEDLERVRNYCPDFILRFAFGILKGPVLQVAPYGVWSFHHGDEMKYRGGPAGMREILFGDPVTGAILQQLTEKLDGGIILRKGFLKTQFHSWKQNLEQLYTVSSSWPAQVANEIRLANAEGRMLSYLPSSSTAPVYKVPENIEMARFMIRLVKNRIRFVFRNLFITEKWNIGLIDQPLTAFALGNESSRNFKISWKPELPGHQYVADPFCMDSDDGPVFLAEHYDYQTLCGTVYKTEVKSGNPGRPVQGLPDFHHSYPFLFRDKDDWYCLPESYASGRITLYKMNRNGSLAEYFATILEDVEAVDPTMVYYTGRWWLFFTNRPWSGTHLFLYSAENLTGPWQPHPMNPVKTDIRSARPAGTPFISEGVLYRPGQDCSVSYGSRIAINKVTEISTSAFAEETTGFLEPDPDGPWPSGLHTVACAGDKTVVDGKTYRLNLYYAFRKVAMKFTINHRQG